MDKRQARAYYKQQTAGLSKKQVEEESSAVFLHLISLPQLKNASSVFVYLSTPNEVQTEEIIGWLWQNGKTVAVPVTDEKGMRSVRYCPGDELTKGKYGLAVPKRDAEEVLPDVILVPGVAFDGEGKRLGRGGGYYDRYFEKYPEALRIGLAFSCQKAERIPSDDWDQEMDLLVCPEGILHFGRDTLQKKESSVR